MSDTQQKAPDKTETHRQRVRIRIAFEIEMDSTDSPGHIPSGLNLPNNEFILAGGRAIGLPKSTVLFGGAMFTIDASPRKTRKKVK